MCELSEDDQKEIERYFKKLARTVHRAKLKLAKKLSTISHRVDPNDIEIDEVTEPDDDGYFNITLKYVPKPSDRMVEIMAMTKEKIDQLERILSKLREAWYQTNGHLRFCQLLWVVTGKDDPFYVEDQDLEEYLKEFVKNAK